MYNTSLTGIVSLTVQREDGQEENFRFMNSITDAGLEFLTAWRRMDNDTMLSNIILAKGSDSSVDVTKVSPAIDPGYPYIRLADQTVTYRPNCILVKYDAVLRTTRDGFHSPQSYSFDEINLMIPHSTNLHDGIYEAVFAKCKIRDTEGNIVTVNVKENERIMINYWIGMTYSDGTALNTEPNKLPSRPSWIGFLQGDNAHSSYSITSRKRWFDDTFLYAKAVPYKGPGYGIAVNIQLKKRATDYSKLEYYLDLGYWSLIINTGTTKTVTADTGAKVNMVLKINRYVAPDKMTDGSYGSAVNTGNGLSGIRVPRGSLVVFYHEGRLFDSIFVPSETPVEYTVPEKYEYDYVTHRLTNRQEIEAFIASKDGLRKIGTINARDSIGPIFVDGEWDEENRVFSFYTELDAVIEAEVECGDSGWKNEDLGTTWVVNYYPRGNDLNNGAQAYLVPFTFTQAMSEGVHPTNPQLHKLSLTMPGPMKHHQSLRIYATDTYQNRSMSPSIFTGYTDYRLPGWTPDYFTDRYRYTDREPQFDPSYVPKDTIFTNLDIVNISIEAIE